ncbi:MAG: hypothetical protein Q9226_009267, partial [Calogaya cf. arnoldii]
MSEMMYDKIPGTDTAWRKLFKDHAMQLLKPKEMSESVRTVFDNFLREGDAQAVDLMEAMCNDYDALLQILQKK